MGTGRCLHEVKKLGCRADHSPPCSTEVTNEWSYRPTPSLCLHIAHIDNLNAHFNMFLRFYYFIQSHESVTTSINFCFIKIKLEVFQKLVLDYFSLKLSVF